MIGKMQHGHLEGVCLFRGVEMIEIEEAIYLLVRILDIFFLRFRFWKLGKERKGKDINRIFVK